MPKTKTIELKKSANTLANKITTLRILLIPAIVITLLHNQKMWTVGLLIFGMATDLLDGLAARKRGERTEFGAVLDPLADKLLLTALYLTLTSMNLIQIWLFVLVFSRDLLIVLGWGVIYILTGSSHVKPRILGKCTTSFQMITALSCIIGFPHLLHQILIWGTVCFTIVSAVDYIIVGEKKIGEW